MPSISKQIKKACWTCRSYEIRIGKDGGPFCAFWGTLFPEPTAWVKNKLKMQPGDRLCENWKSKNGKNSA